MEGCAAYRSRRWKSDIQPLQGALGKVERLRGVSYTYTANGKHDIGMIAEEVGRVVPEVVSYEDNGKDARGIDYARLTALLVEAVKQQQSEIQQQQRQVQQQEKQIRQQRAEIRTLQARVRRLETTNADAVQPAAKPAKTGAATW
ncbi:MAG: tail fiber domain-containing protein [Terriglobia bacterium]